MKLSLLFRVQRVLCSLLSTLTEIGLVNKNPLENDALPSLDGSSESVIADSNSENYLDSLLELLDLDNSQYELEFPSIGGVT